MLKTVVIPPAMPAHLVEGELIAGRYRLERELGRGAMGMVWSAVHVTLGQRVAIKLIAPEQLSSQEARQRFSTEAKAAARLKSRHVVQIYDDGETKEGIPYIVLEYLEGETLEARLERQGTLSLADAVRVATHVGRALGRAHAQGIIHRDLKPANIFIATAEDDDQGWIVKVLDFGVAKLLGSSDPSPTRAGALVGTPLFMSPEQVRGASEVDRRADLYSLGMVFFNMVTGRFAFDAASYSDVLVRICLEPLPDLRQAAEGLPQGLYAWFEQACARDPALRFQSAEEMLEALVLASGQPPRNSRVSLPDDALGPSGTVLGYSAPDLSAASFAGGTALLAGPSGTLRSSVEPQPANAQARAVEVPLVTPRGSEPEGAVSGDSMLSAVPRRPAWLLWLAAGAGLGLALAGSAVILILGATRSSEPRPADASAAAKAAASATLLAEVAARPIPPPPIVAPSASSAGAAQPSASAATPPSPRPRARAAAARRPATSAPPAPKAVKGGAPDIGF